MALDIILQAEGPSEHWANLGVRLADLTGQGATEFLNAAMTQYPYAIGPRLLVARSLLQQNQHHLALPHLELLSSLRCAEAAYFLGVASNRDGDYESALRHMSRALELNPGHEETLAQVQALRKLLEGENGEPS